MKSEEGALILLELRDPECKYFSELRNKLILLKILSSFDY